MPARESSKSPSPTLRVNCCGTSKDPFLISNSAAAGGFDDEHIARLDIDCEFSAQVNGLGFSGSQKLVSTEFAWLSAV
jgi:hypothetical protein